MYMDEGMEYSMDGDVIDSRNRIIQELKSQVATYRAKEYYENKARRDSPALQDAWDKYQTILELTRDA